MMMASFLLYIVRWAVVLTMLYSLYGLFLKRETLHAVNRIVLLVILVAAMVLPLVQVETSEPNIVTQSREQLEQKISNVQMLTPSQHSTYRADASPASLVTDGTASTTGVGRLTVLLVVLIYI